MSAAHNFASFATYAPPPDELPSNSSSGRTSQRPWFATYGSQADMSYQSGGLPNFGISQSGSLGLGAEPECEDSIGNQWHTGLGWRVDIMAATTYVLGPVTALLFLMIETVNDYVRFHAYQSALFTTPILLASLILVLVGVSKWVIVILDTWLIVGICYMAYRAYRDAINGGMSRFRLPVVGDLAERWVAEE